MSLNKDTRIADNVGYSLGKYSDILDSKHIFDHHCVGKYIYDFTWRFLILRDEAHLQKNVSLVSYDDIDPSHPLFTSDVFIDLVYDRSLICDKVYNRIISGIRSIQWNSYILEEVNKYKNDFSNTLGVSVRSWTAPHEKNISRRYNKDAYLDLINKVTKEHSIDTILLSVDNPGLYNEYIKDLSKFNIIIYTPEKQYTELQYVCIKLLFLSNCKCLIGSKISTFTEMSFWLSECKQLVYPV